MGFHQSFKCSILARDQSSWFPLDPGLRRYYLVLLFVTFYLHVQRYNQDLSKHLRWRTLKQQLKLSAVDLCCKCLHLRCLRERWLLLCYVVNGFHLLKFAFLQSSFLLQYSHSCNSEVLCTKCKNFKLQEKLLFVNLIIVALQQYRLIFIDIC